MNEKWFIQVEVKGLKREILNLLSASECPINVSYIAKKLGYSYKSVFNSVKFLEENSFIISKRQKTKKGFERLISLHNKKRIFIK